MKTNQILLASAVIASFAAPWAMAQETTNARQLATQVCASCHGPRGESVSSAFPRLAGQQAQYVDVQLKAFRDRTRADPMAQGYMWGMASQLGDAAIRNLAAYYSAQKPVHGKGQDAKLVQAGKAIYDSGVPGANAQPCGTCHGAGGEGNGIYPRLAGQHAEYLVKQLVVFKDSLRTDSNAAIMHDISANMSFEQMQAVATYLASR